MTLIIGGAYQGKLAYAVKAYQLKEADIFICTDDGQLDVSKRCICHLEEYVLGCVRRNVEPAANFREDAVLICRDISCGVVPLETDLRAWREATGRLLNTLGQQANTVIRLFCGLPQRLK